MKHFYRGSALATAAARPALRMRRSQRVAMQKLNVHGNEQWLMQTLPFSARPLATPAMFESTTFNYLDVALATLFLGC